MAACLAAHLWNLYFAKIALQREGTPFQFSCLRVALQSTGLEHRLWGQAEPGLNPSFVTPALWTWLHKVTFLNISFPVCEMELVIIPTSRTVSWLNDVMHVKHLAQKPALSNTAIGLWYWCCRWNCHNATSKTVRPGCLWLVDKRLGYPNPWTEMVDSLGEK